MYIDFHTHVFPEKIAKKAVDSLTARAKEAHGGKDMLSPCTDGTLDGLKAEMNKRKKRYLFFRRDTSGLRKSG